MLTKYINEKLTDRKPDGFRSPLFAESQQDFSDIKKCQTAESEVKATLVWLCIGRADTHIQTN